MGDPMPTPKNPDRPLWLPQGSVRALLALLIVGAAVVYSFVSTPEQAAPLWTVAGAITVFYFKERGDAGS